MLAVIVGCAAFILPTQLPLVGVTHRHPAPVAGLFDMFKETPEQKAAKDREWREQQEMLARRRDPKAMEKYLSETEQRRAAASAKDRELKQLQKGDGTGADKLDMWNKLKEAVSLTHESPSPYNDPKSHRPCLHCRCTGESERHGRHGA